MSSKDSTSIPTAKLTVSGGKAGGAPYRPASSGKVEGTSSPSGLSVSAAAVGGKPDRVARITLGTPEIDTDDFSVTIGGSVTAAQPGTEITSLSIGWGDGTTEDLSFPAGHTYDSAAAYTVTITATNNRSESQSTSLNVVVPIVFADAGLEAAVRDGISKPTGDIFTADVENLTFLNAEDREIVSLDGLEMLSALDTLRIRRNQLSDISLLAQISTLTAVALDNNPIADFSPLATMTQLTGLWIRGEEIPDDISFVADLTNLETLLFIESSVSDISPVANLTNLTILWIRNNEITDISSVANLTSLELLNLSSNMISDISPVADLTALTFLGLGDNQISDISAVANLTAVTSLPLNDNEIIDISALENLTELNVFGLDNNQITDLTPLVDNAGLGTDDTVSVIGNSLSAEATSTQIPAPEARGVIVNQ